MVYYCIFGSPFTDPWIPRIYGMGEPGYQYQSLQTVHSAYNKKLDDGVRDMIDNFRSVISTSKVRFTNCFFFKKN